MNERLVLNFHGIGTAPASVPAAEVAYWCSVERFQSLLDEVGPLSASTGLPLAITFDDGNRSDATIALPALAARGLQASFFVCAGRIGQPGYLDAPALRELLSAGMTIGSHGWHHVDWRRADQPTLERETQGALDEITSVIGQVVDEVGVPFGSYDRRVLAQLRRSGVRKAFTSDGGTAPLSAWLVPRLSYATSWTASTLREAASRPDSGLAWARRQVIRAIKRLR